MHFTTLLYIYIYIIFKNNNISTHSSRTSNDPAGYCKQKDPAGSCQEPDGTVKLLELRWQSKIKQNIRLLVMFGQYIFSLIWYILLSSCSILNQFEASPSPYQAITYDNATCSPTRLVKLKPALIQYIYTVQRSINYAV